MSMYTTFNIIQQDIFSLGYYPFFVTEILKLSVTFLVVDFMKIIFNFVLK